MVVLELFHSWKLLVFEGFTLLDRNSDSLTNFSLNEIFCQSTQSRNFVRINGKIDREWPGLVARDSNYSTLDTTI